MSDLALLTMHLPVRKPGVDGDGHWSPDHLTHHRHTGSVYRNPFFPDPATMDDWIDYYNSTHTIYASKLHRDLHFQVIARDIIGYISSPDAVVLDYACGEALSAAQVAEACGKLYLAEPAPGVRGRLIARFAPNTKIRVRSLDDLRKMDRKIDRSRGHEFGRAIHDAGRTRCRVCGDPPAAETQRSTGTGRYPASGGRHDQGRDRRCCASRRPTASSGTR